MRHIHNLAEDAARTLISAVQRGRRGMERRQGPGCRGRQNQGEVTEPRKRPAVDSLRRARHKQQGFTGMARAPIRSWSMALRTEVVDVTSGLLLRGTLHGDVN